MRRKLDTAPRRPTISSVYLVQLLTDLSACGVDATPILKSLFDEHELACLERGERLELERQAFLHAYGRGVVMLEQAVCRKHTRSKNRQEALELFVAYVAGASTLLAACQRASQFNSVLEDRGYTLTLAVVDDVARFAINLTPLTASPPASLAASSALCLFNLFSYLTANPLSLHRIGLAHPRRADAAFIGGVLAAKLEYGADENFIEFAASDLTRRIVCSPESIRDLTWDSAYDPLLFGESSAPLSARIRSLLDQMTECGERLPDSVLVAERLGVSQSTLARRLKAEDTSYLNIKSERQYQWAKHMLVERALKMPEIAKRLGFTDVRSFRRSFVRWHGSTPSEFQSSSSKGRQISNESLFVPK